MRIAFSSILLLCLITSAFGLRRAELDPDLYAVAVKVPESRDEASKKIVKRLSELDGKARELEERTELLSEPEKARLSGAWTTFAIARAEASRALSDVRRLPDAHLAGWIDDQRWHCELIEATLAQIESRWQ
jgi:hypothetical protein